MANTTDKDSDTLVTPLGDFSVPDVSDLDVLPADHVFVPPESVAVIGEFVPGAPAGSDDASVVEFNVADLQSVNLLADIDSDGDMDIDLNGLLESVTASMDQEAGNSDGTQDAENLTGLFENPDTTQYDAETSSFSTLQTDFGLSELTIIIEDDGSDTVAL